MEQRSAVRLARRLLGLSILLWLISLGIAASSGPPAPNAPATLEVVASNPWIPAVLGGVFLLFSALGALMASRRPENNLGWLFCIIGVVSEFGNLVGAYSYHALLSDPGSLPLGPQAGLFGDISWLPGVAFIGFLFLLYPSGRLHTRTERWTFRGLLFGVTAGALGQALETQLYAIPSIKDPLGFHLPPAIGGAISGVGFFLVGPFLIVSAILLIRRFARSRGDEREQMKWFAYTSIFAIVATFSANLQDNPPPWVIGLLVIAYSALPVSVAIAILKYRLYEIDVIINKTVVYGALAAFITAVYVGIVAGVGTLAGHRAKPNFALSIVATAVVAVAFQPLRERLQHFANRLVYGKRATPYEVLAGFSDQVGGTYANEEVLPQTARVLAEATGAARADVWLRVDGTLSREATYPEGAAVGHETVDLGGGDSLPAFPDAGIAAPVVLGDELLGALSVTKPPGEPPSPAEETLVQDLASQAGLVLHNVRLTSELEARLQEIERQAAELRASRQRIIAAQDAERRRLERNIHDGAQQHLVALAVKLRLAKALTATDAGKARALLEELQTESTDALETLRDLARGIYPPLLQEQGLAEALAAQTGKSTLPVTVHAGGVGRFPIEVEAAAYFCCLEALQNTAKSANADEAVITLSGDGDSLRFSVSDDGRGFDPATVARGSGLQNMTDRVEALGGSLEVTSAPGAGTTVEGCVPATGSPE